MVPNEAPPSAKVIVPPSASIVTPPAPPSKVTVVPANSAVPFAVICMWASEPTASVVTMSSVPLAPAVNVAVSLALPVIVMTLSSKSTVPSTDSAVRVPRLVTLPWAAVCRVPVS